MSAFSYFLLEADWAARASMLVGVAVIAASVLHGATTQGWTRFAVMILLPMVLILGVGAITLGMVRCMSAVAGVELQAKSVVLGRGIEHALAALDETGEVVLVGALGLIVGELRRNSARQRGKRRPRARIEGYLYKRPAEDTEESD